MAPSLGWNDPTWQQLYGAAPATPEQQDNANPAEAPVVDYLSQLKDAAAANVNLNLSDMPGYQTNLQLPEA